MTRRPTTASPSTEQLPVCGKHSMTQRFMLPADSPIKRDGLVESQRNFKACSPNDGGVLLTKRVLNGSSFQKKRISLFASIPPLIVIVILS